MSSVSPIEEILQSVLKEGADRLGTSTGLIKRVRAFRGSTFAQLMILGQMQPDNVALSDLAHFATHLKVKVSEQAIAQRFTSTTAIFFEEVLNLVFTQVLVADPVAIALLSRFSEVIVENSSTFSLPDELKDV